MLVVVDAAVCPANVWQKKARVLAGISIMTKCLRTQYRIYILTGQQIESNLQRFKCFIKVLSIYKCLNFYVQKAGIYQKIDEIVFFISGNFPKK